MGLVYHRSGAITERTRWNLSFSGVSFSQKRGRITLNTRGRSNFRVAKGLNLRIHNGTAFILWIVFFIWDLLVLLLKGVTFVIAAPIEFLYYRIVGLFAENQEKKSPKTPAKTRPEASKKIDCLDKTSAPGIYDLKTVTGVLYELHLAPEGEDSTVFLDGNFGEVSAVEDGKGLVLHDFQVKTGARGRFVVEKTPGKLSALYTPKIVEILQVAAKS